MTKGRYWASVGYPESLPINFIDILQQKGLPVAISPLHDRDIDDRGEIKKPHYHFIFAFSGPTTYNNVKKLCDELNLTIPIKLESVKGMYRYHIHQDNLDKFQYNDYDRILLNGFNSDVDSLTRHEVNMIVSDILSFIDDNDIVEYCDLVKSLKDKKDLFDVVISKTILFNTYLTSKRNKIKSLQK